MRKNRNSFFQENMPPYNFNVQNPNMPFNNIEERLAKIERSINRLEHRISIIENSSVSKTTDFDNSNNDLYIL